MAGGIRPCGRLRQGVRRGHDPFRLQGGADPRSGRGDLQRGGGQGAVYGASPRFRPHVDLPGGRRPGAAGADRHRRLERPCGRSGPRSPAQVHPTRRQEDREGQAARRAVRRHALRSGRAGPGRAGLPLCHHHPRRHSGGLQAPGQGQALHLRRHSARRQDLRPRGVRQGAGV